MQTPAVPVPTLPPLPEGEFPLFSGIYAYDRDYKNPRITTFNVAFEQELAPDWSAYVDFTYAEGDRLTRFLNYGRPGLFAPQLGDTFFVRSGETFESYFTTYRPSGSMLSQGRRPKATGDYKAWTPGR